MQFRTTLKEDRRKEIRQKMDDETTWNQRSASIPETFSEKNQTTYYDENQRRAGALIPDHHQTTFAEQRTELRT